MKIDVSVSDDIVIVKPAGDIRVKSILFLRQVFEQLSSEGHARIAIDLSKVHFVDSSGIGLLLNFAKIQKDNKGGLFLFNYHTDVKELLDLVDLGDFIPVYEKFDQLKNALSN
jgi:anti-anti-sigma factor